MNSGKAAAKWVATYGMLIGLACIFSYVEAIVPVPIPIPGVKLGLANLVAIVGLYTIWGQRNGGSISGKNRFCWVYFRQCLQHDLQHGRRNRQPGSHDSVSEDELVQSDWGQHHWRYRP